MMQILAGIVLALCRGSLWVLALVFKSLVAWVLWILWPILVLAGALGLAIASATPCEAGWMDWLWGENQDAEKLRRAADLAGESARIAGQVAAAQAQHASEQARQNTQVAEMLKELSSERQEYSRQLESLAGLAMRDSEWAAALSATGPLIICVAVLVVAGLALWLVMRPAGFAGQGSGAGAAAGYEAGLAMDMLIEELARAQAGSQGAYFAEPHVAASSSSSRVALPAPVGRLTSSGPYEQAGPEELAEPEEPDGLDEDGCPF